jgi:hypothetical protein
MSQVGLSIVEKVMPGMSGIVYGAEIGVAEGNLSAWLLRNIPSLHLTMVDRWAAVSTDHPYYLSGDSKAKWTQKQFDAVKQQAVKQTDFAKHRRNIIQMESIEAANLVHDGSLHLVFLDSTHTYEGTFSDLNSWVSKVKESGWVCGHDIDFPNQPKWGVRRAVEEYMSTWGYGQKPLLGNSYTWFFKKEKLG